MNKNSLNKRNYISDICVLRIFTNLYYVCYYINIYTILQLMMNIKTKIFNDITKQYKKCVNAL